MKIKLNEVPFSTAGSYMALSYLADDFHGWQNKKGLYLRSVHGTDANCAGVRSMIARIIPTYHGEEIESEVTAVPEAMTIDTAHGTITAAYYNEDTLVFSGKGDGLGMVIDFTPVGSGDTFNMVEQWQGGDRPWYVTYIYANSRRYMIYFQKGSGTVSQNWNGESAKNVKSSIESTDGSFLMVVEECVDAWYDKGIVYDIDAAVSSAKASYEKFLSTMPSVPAEYQETAEYAAYVNWSCIIRPAGLFKRYAMYMSKNWMTSVWSWDHCFNAMASAYGDPDTAWDQFMVMFDQQQPSGMIPDSLNDLVMLIDYCKPPIHGWTYHKLKQLFEISDERKKEAYDKLVKWTNWWLNYRDINHDGLCEYAHGNDSGWDNSTAFIEGGPLTTPDLAVFMILQMDELSEIASELGKCADSISWKKRSDEMLSAMLEKLFIDGKPAAIHSFSGEAAENKSLLMYLPILLGDRLPVEIRKNLINGLSEFETPYGYATEQPGSPLYTPDGYWRGPIWAPSTMILVDGLEACGQHEQAVKTARAFCDMVKESGCSENFNALTGEGLRDRAYTWTASVMLVLAHEYLL